MGCVHQRAECGSGGAINRLQHSGVFKHHMARPAQQHIGQHGKLRHADDIAQRRHPQQPGGFLAFGPARVVAAVRQRAGDARIEHQHAAGRGQIDEAPRQAAGVEQQGFGSVGQAGGHLVHDAAAHASEFDLGALGQLGDLHIVQCQAEQLAEAAQRSHFQRRAGRQAHANRHGGRDMNVQRRYWSALVPRQHQAAVHIAGKMVGRRLRQGKAHRLTEFGRMQGKSKRAVAAHRDMRALRNGDRQHEAVVVVGVLAQQVDPPRRAGFGLGRCAVNIFEPAHDKSTWTCCSSSALSSGSASIAKKPAPISVPARYFSRSRVR